MIRNADSMDFAQRVKVIEQISIEHPYFVHALNCLQHGIAMRQAGGEPRHTLLIGESGVGKTYLVNHLASKFPSHEIDGWVRIPLGVVQTPAVPTLKSLAEATLHGLGDPFAGRGTASNMRNRALKIIENGKVEMLIFEELHHFIDNGTRAAVVAVADWLKSFIDCSRVCVLLTGLPRSQGLLDINEQLRRRFSTHLIFDRFLYETSEEERLFRAVLNKIDNALPVKEIQGLAEPDLARRLYFASNGLIGYLMKLILSAFELMVQQRCIRLDVSLFEIAFIESVWRDGVGRLNPFSSEFCFEHLDKFGQPYNVSVPTRNAKGRRPRSGGADA